MCVFIYTRKCEQAPSWMHHFAAKPAKDIKQPANKSEPVPKTIAGVKGLRYVEKRDRYVLKVDSCDKMYVFQLKDWVTEEAIARAASEIRAVIIRSWVIYSTKTVAQLKEVLRGRKASTSGRRDQLLRMIVTLTAPEDPTPPTSVSSEADKADESTSAKYKLPAGVLTSFRDYISSKRQTGMRFKAYLLGKVDLDEKMQIEALFIPKQSGFDDVQEEGNSRYLWPEDRTIDTNMRIYTCFPLHLYSHLFIYIYIDTPS